MNEEIITIDKCGENIKIDIGGASSSVISVNGRYGYIVLDKNDVNLSNVDNTSDANKPLSNATIFALMSSVNWNKAYNQVYTTSSSWINQKVIDYTHSNFIPLSGNSMITGKLSSNRDFYVWGNIVSGGKSLVDLLASFGSDELARTLLFNGSANWDRVFSSVNSNSAAWDNAANTITSYLPLSGGIVTGMVGASGFKVDNTTYSGQFIGNPSTELVRIILPYKQYIKMYVQNQPRYLLLNEFEYLEQWTNENGDVFVNESGDVLMF